MRPVERGARTLALALLVWVASCSRPLPTEAPTDEELREQIHLATGHDPTHCSDQRGGDASITIGATGVEPDCIIVSADSTLTIVNDDRTTQTFFVGDPATSATTRHIRVEAEIGPHREHHLEPVSGYLGIGLYPYWLRGIDDDAFTGTVIIRS
jgi:hypothetical protein